MNRPKPTVTIAIPAHNEQANIRSLLKSLLSQRTSHFLLRRILVICDGCTDSTARQARSVKDPRIVIQDDGRRLGKNARLNEIFSHFKGDILVVCDADILLSNSTVIDSLVSPFTKYPRLGISCGYHTPLLPHNLIQKIAYFGFQIWDSARKLKGSSAVRYYCEGALRAFSKPLTTRLRFPENTPLDEDSYSFYAAVSQGFLVKIAFPAEIHFKLPQTLADYSSQLKRYLSAPMILSAHFKPQLLKKYEVITPATKLFALILTGLRHPLIGSLYLPVQFVIKVQMLFYTPPVIWTTSPSTKSQLS